ncbi:MAG: hypothetical protein IT336_07505, partial [Thermomicrobiales bacterium]|nr:hypothetical protein [Thermomicrobiales bacterium]
MTETLPKTARDRFVAFVTEIAANPKPIGEVGIPMRDGVELAADIHFPEQ